MDSVRTIIEGHKMIREIKSKDINKEYLQLLCQLSNREGQNVNFLIPDFAFWRDYAKNENHQIYVYEHEGDIVGTASILVDNKVGRVEDVVVDRESRLGGVGRQLVNRCIEFARAKEGYKVILECSEDNIPFYEACGFRRSDNCMRIDL